jgi:DUF1009 family protein
MPASEESRLRPAPYDIERLGIIAGGGKLPLRLIIACEQAGIDVFVVAFEGQTDPAILKGRNHIVTRLGAAGRVINTLKAHEVRDIVMIGSIRRPTLSELRPDMKALGMIARQGMKGLGDDGLLRALKKEFESVGFRFHGVQRFVTDLLADPGILGRHKPNKDAEADIRRAIRVVRALGRLDVGQAAIVQEGIVLGVEGAEGTDELIRRCAAYKRKGQGAVLVKLCKPQQDTDLDLPTVGPDTVNLCAHAGMAGIAVEAGKTLILDPQDVVTLADRNGLFIAALTPEELDRGA